MDNTNATAASKQAEHVHVFDPVAILKEGCLKVETGVEQAASRVGANLKNMWNNAGNESKDLKSLFFTPLSDGTIGGALIHGARALGKAGIEANAAGASGSAIKDGATAPASSAAGTDAKAGALSKAAAVGAATGAIDIITLAATAGEIATGSAAAMAAAGAAEAGKRAVEKAAAAAGKEHAQVDKPTQK